MKHITLLLNHCKDPYEPTSLMQSKRFFLFWWLINIPRIPLGVLFTAQVLLGASLLLITSPSTSETSARWAILVEIRRYQPPSSLYFWGGVFGCPTKLENG